MARGKYLSLEEARKGETKGATIGRFCKEHPSKADKRFWPLLKAAAKGSPAAGQTSTRGTSGGYSGTRTRQDTSEDASD